MQSPNPDGVVVDVFACTDVGRTRDHNEDAFVIFDPRRGRFGSMDDVVTVHPPPEGILFMVADGMGGAAAGELASAMAVDTVAEVLQRLWSGGTDAAFAQENFADSLRRATNAANNRIHRFASENVEHRGMGTTATMAALLEDTLYLSQVGDSRAYLARGGVVHQLTRDQSLIQRLVDAGELTQEEAEQSERRNIILQALGPEPSVRSDISFQLLRRNDILILCSDGLSGQVSPSDMERILAARASLKDICLELIALANERGGPDNITVVAARFTGNALHPFEGNEKVGYHSFSPASGESWRFTPADTYDASAPAATDWFGNSTAGPPEPSRNNESPTVGQGTGGRSRDGFSRAVLYGLIAAVAAGVALVLYRRFF
jgi:protein phosphatase